MFITLLNLLDYGMYLMISSWKNGKLFPKDYMLWRLETIYGISAQNFSFGKLPSIGKLTHDILKFGRWLTMMNYERKYFL